MMDDPEREPWEILAEKIVTALPDQLRKPLMGSIEQEPPHPKEDPLAPFRETVGLSEILERSQERRYNFGPRGPELPTQ